MTLPPGPLALNGDALGLQVFAVKRGGGGLLFKPSPKRHALKFKAAGGFCQPVLFNEGGECHGSIVTGDTILRKWVLTDSVSSDTICV